MDWKVSLCGSVSVRVYRYVCVGGGEMCNLRLVMCPQRQSSTAFVLRIPLEGILPAWLEGNWRLSSALQYLRSPLARSFSQKRRAGLRCFVPEEAMPSLGSILSL